MKCFTLYIRNLIVHKQVAIKNANIIDALLPWIIIEILELFLPVGKLPLWPHNIILKYFSYLNRRYFAK